MHIWLLPNNTARCTGCIYAVDEVGEGVQSLWWHRGMKSLETGPERFSGSCWRMKMMEVWHCKIFISILFSRLHIYRVWSFSGSGTYTRHVVCYRLIAWIQFSGSGTYTRHSVCYRLIAWIQFFGQRYVYTSRCMLSFNSMNPVFRAAVRIHVTLYAIV